MTRPPQSLSLPQRFVRWGFDRFYQEFAWTYDAVAALVSAGHWRRWVLSVLPELDGAVLELGCGPGHLQRALAQRGGVSVGLDRSAQMVRRAARGMNNPQITQITQIDRLPFQSRRIRRPEGDNPQITQITQIDRLHLRGRLIQADFRAIPLASHSVDRVVATFPTEQIVAAMTLSEVRRVLRPGGRFVILLAARLSGQGAYQRAVDRAYRLTYQRPASADLIDPIATTYLERFRAGGFAVNGAWRPVSGGEALIVIAEPL